MADDAIRVLVCLVEGESSIFKVNPTSNMDVTDLKDLIHQKGVGTFAKDLILWKVRKSMASYDATESFAG